MTNVAADPETARLALVEELAGVLAFNAALRDRFAHRAVRLRGLLRSGHLTRVEYAGEMTPHDQDAAAGQRRPRRAVRRLPAAWLGRPGKLRRAHTEGAPVTDTPTE